MRTSQILKKIGRGDPALGVTLHLTDSSLFEMVGLMGFDGVWMDMEHHFYSLDVAADMMRAARVGGADIVARPAKGEFSRLSRMLEAGATGIMYPRCESPAEAAEVVKWAKFAPLGRRGFDGSGPDVPYLMTPIAEYLQHANNETFVIIQLEEEAAIRQAAEIIAIPGVDMLMLGPADFSILSGFPGEFDDPRIAAAIETVAAAARQAKKHWAATCGTPEQARRMVELGARLVFHGADIVFVKQSLDAIKATFEQELGFRFRNQDSNQ